MTPLLISLQWLLGKLRPARLGLHRLALLPLAVPAAGHPRARGRRAGRASRAVLLRLQSRVLGRHPGDRLDRAGRLRRQERGAQAGRWSASPRELQRTVFVDRARRQQTGDAVGEIVSALAGGISVVLFAEGTSSDGNRVLPFRSALIGAVEQAAARRRARHPASSRCRSATPRLHGIPMGRQHRPLVAWYGDLDFMPHIKSLDRARRDRCGGDLGEPVAADGATDRKAMTTALEGTVRGLTGAALLTAVPRGQR